MAEFPALPLWTDAYLGDTTHLTTIEHGAYLLLLMTAWRSKETRLPDDDKILARYARCTAGQWRRIRPVLELFFRIENGFWMQGRLTDEAKAVRQLRDQRVCAGRASALKRKGRHSTGADSPLNEREAPTPTPITTPDKEEESMPARAGDFAFFGQTIKLAPRHLDQWRRLFHSIPDVEAELSTLDDWWQAQPPEKRGNWFLATKGMLNKRHQENLSVRRDYDPGRITV